jgi:hypothetical protein
MRRRRASLVLVPALALLAGAAVVLAAGPPPMPDGWTVHTDPTGSCRVATPGGWVAGRDFFLGRESAGRDVTWSSGAGRPSTGYALWGIDTSDRSQLAALPIGTRYQLRTTLMRGGLGCSVWRIKAGADFTAAEKAAMQRVGTTLEVLP